MAIFDESEIETAHQVLLSEQTGKQLIKALQSCCDVIRSESLIFFATEPRETVVRVLGNRIVNSLGAASKLLDAGYFNACSAQIRDIAETALLMHYFTNDRDQIDRWLRLEGRERYQKFGFGQLKRELPDNEKEVLYWARRFNHHSELGTHPSPAAILGVHDGSVLHLGPHIDKEKYMGFVLDLANDACKAVSIYLCLLEAGPSQLPKVLENELGAFEEAKSVVAEIYGEASDR